MIEYAASLLPIAAASGWYIAYRHYKVKKQNSTLDHSGYFKGLNYLLNEQPDKAIDVFIDLLEVGNETIETHLALGTLFRQRGEVEKSIRLHQNLIARPQLGTELKNDVLNELGLDYMRAGLLDRAENIFLELEQQSSHRVNAVNQLLSIYQQESDWSKAIDYALILEKIEKASLPVLLSNLYCELAKTCLIGHDLSLAKLYLKKAAKKDANCIRVVVMQAEISADEGDYKSALNYYLNIQYQDKRFIPVFLEQILGCFNMLNKQKEKLSFLTSIGSEIESSILVDSLVMDMKVEQGEAEAIEFVKNKLAQSPTLSYLMLYSKLVLASGQPQENSAFLLDAINKLYRVKLSFHCEQCGFDSTELNWHCPSCKTWGSCLPAS